MKKKIINWPLFCMLCLLSATIWSQDAEPKEENTDYNTDTSSLNDSYSIFNDFRIPVRENISNSDLRYDGWKTETGMYTFRCRDKKRIRLTFWYLDKGPKEVLDSEFINITPAIDDCQKKDPEYQNNSAN